MKSIHRTVPRNLKKKSNRIVTHFGRTFDKNDFTVRTVHEAEKALLIIRGEIDGDDSETNEPGILNEEVDEDEKPPAEPENCPKPQLHKCEGWPNDKRVTVSFIVPWGLFEMPTGGWFCDDECKKNAGFRVAIGSGRKRRR